MIKNQPGGGKSRKQKIRRKYGSRQSRIQDLGSSEMKELRRDKNRKGKKRKEKRENETKEKK